MDTVERVWVKRAVWAVGIGVLVVILFSTLLREVSLAGTAAIGLQRGAIYSLVALGIALVYKATRVLNFAQGELGTVPAFVALLFVVGGDLGETATMHPGRLWWATLAAVAAGIILAVLINVLVVQRLAEATPVTALVATVAVAFLLSGLQLIIFEARARRFPRYIDGAPGAVQMGPVCLGTVEDGSCVGNLAVGGITVSWHTFIIVGVLAVAAAFLAILFRTPVGVALLATAQEPFAAQLQGVSVRTMGTLAWAAAGALGALAGLLGGGIFNSVAPGFMTSTFLVEGFTGALLGGITSMVGAVVGGLSIGLVVALANAVNRAYDLGLPSPPHIAILVVLLLVLLLRPRGLFGKEA